MKNQILQFKNQTWDLTTQAYMMGIVNLTPDSFSDGGQFFTPAHALSQIEKLITEGAHAIDIGAESTRPQSIELSTEEEWSRLEPVLKELPNQLPVPISIDTRKAEIARRSLDYGVEIINDVSGGRFEKKILEHVAHYGAHYILMHSRGTPQNMMTQCQYRDLLTEIENELNACFMTAMAAGISQEKIMIDPGFGFAKNSQQNIDLLKGLSAFKRTESPFVNQALLIGLSRKRFIRESLGDDQSSIEEASAAAAYQAYLQGARIFRVHQVAFSLDFFKRKINYD